MLPKKELPKGRCFLIIAATYPTYEVSTALHSVAHVSSPIGAMPGP